MIKHFLIFSCFLLLLSSVSKSQKVDTNSVAYLLDDGKISNAKNLIKINFIAPIVGDVPVYYERIIGKHFGIEAGVGVLLPYYGPDGLGLLYHDNNKEIINPDLGYSLWLQPKFYFFNKAPEYNYMGFQYRKRHYNLQSGQQIEYIDLTINFGYQFFITNRLMLDYNLGVGFRQRKYPVYHVNNKNDQGLMGLAMPINLRLGYIF